MGFTPATLLPTVEQVAYEALVEVVLPTEFGDGHAHAVEFFACLIRCKGGVHSVHLCSNVFMYH